MKKLILTSVCVLAVTGAAFAQGYVNWSGISFANMTAQTNSTETSPLVPGGGISQVGTIGNTVAQTGAFYYELLYNGVYTGTQASVTSLSSLLSWSDAGIGAQSAASAGRLSVLNATTQATVPWASGTTDNIVMVCWSADLGTSWSTVSTLLAGGQSAWTAELAGQAGFLGITTTGYISPYTGNPGAAVFGAAQIANVGLPIYSPGTQLYLLPVPEPGTMALAGLGGLALLLFRRRK